LAGLFAPDIEWRGITTGRLWWRRTPICRGADEARATLRHWFDRAAVGDLDAAVIAADGDRVIVELHSLGDALYEVVTFDGARIIDIQDCPNREAAFKFARRG
jgi:ketosteroid isomerase-like protein